MTATDSSSSATSPNPDLFRIELEGKLPPLPTAFHSGRDLDLLDPIKIWDDAEIPPATTGPLVTSRAEIARALGADNAAFGHRHADELATKLADPATRVIVTGQQPGLFGGPLLALSKTLAAIKYANTLEAQGTKAVAVFWVATEDHDWAEIASSTFLQRQDPAVLSLGDDLEPLRPVGKRRIGAGVDEVADAALGLIYGDDALARLERALEIYGPDQEVGEAFIRLMLEILGDRAPLYLDAQSPAIKELQKPMLRALIEKRRDLDAAYAESEATIQARSYALQVSPQPGVSPLFLEKDGERRRIEWRGDDRFSLRGLDDYEESVDELLAILEADPGRISPGVLARPAIQDALLGTTLQILGPAELSYMPQASAAHELLGLTGVHTTLRPQTMTIEAKFAGWLEELEIPLIEVLERSLEEALAERKGEDLVTPAREAIEAQLAALRESALDVDKSLAKPFDKTRDHITRGLDTLSSKIAAAVARNHQTWLRRLEQIRANLAPGGSWQERRLSTTYLWCRHGDALVETLYEALDLDPRRLSVARLD